MEEVIREEIAQIERDNHAIWSRMLRERFDGDVALEVDWEAFEAHSTECGRLLLGLGAIIFECLLEPHKDYLC